jgi:hypothetical protein
MIGMYFMVKHLADHGFRMVSPVFTKGAMVANRPHDFFIDTGLFFRHCFGSFLNGLVPGSMFSGYNRLKLLVGLFNPEP